MFTPEKNTAEKGIRLTAQEMLKQGTAAIVMYDLYALQLLNELKRQGVAVGRDFSLAGFDGIHEAEVAGLSTVVQPLEELVNQAFKLLQDRHQELAPKVRVLPSCVFRSSTGPCP
jgi:DNA-binding LacI/PurR family transcriptional regulator